MYFRSRERLWENTERVHVVVVRKSGVAPKIRFELLVCCGDRKADR